MNRKSGLIGVDLHENFWLKEVETKDFVHRRDLSPFLYHLAQCATKQHGQMLSHRASNMQLPASRSSESPSGVTQESDTWRLCLPDC